jgi:DNA-binding CsgD family transcriptional regulator
MIFAAANFAALRLEQLAGPDVNRIGSRARLTSRELAVLRLVSTGGQTHDIAQALALGEETIRSHLKKGRGQARCSQSYARGVRGSTTQPDTLGPQKTCGLAV